MIEQHPKEEILSIIKEIEIDPSATQRTISKNLGISLGKTNYLLQELIKKGLVKARHFSETPKKLAKINYILTKNGFKEMVRLTRLYLDIKEKEYIKLKRDWQRVSSVRL